VAGLLCIFGCSDDGGTSRRTATPADLESRAFTFADGGAFAASLANTAVTLTFRDFGDDGDGNPNTGPFTLASAAGTAGGTVTVGSCTLAIEESTFEAATFPDLQAAQTITLDPCEIHPDDNRLRVQNAATGVTSTSDPSSNLPTTNVAFVLTTDFSTGSYSVVDIATRETFNDIGLGAVNSDIGLARFFNNRIYVVNRFGADNIQIIDPQQGYTTPPNAQLSMGSGSNPQDIAFIDPAKAYVSRLEAAALQIINPTTLTLTGTLDLQSLVKPNDPDGLPEPAQMLVQGGLLYVALQHLDPFFVPVAPGEIAVIDPATDQIDTVIPLTRSNPFSALQFSAALNRILISTIGGFRAFGNLDNDGGIEAIDPVTHAVELIIDEDTLGGDITHFEIVSATKGFAIVVSPAAAGINNTLVSFNPTTGAVTMLAGPFDTALPHFAINSRGELYLTVREPAAPGVRIFDTTREPAVEVTADTLRLGLPSFYVLFIE
jgi:hypothetical protein